MNEQWKQWALKKNPNLIDRKVIEDIKAEIEQNIGDNLYKNDGLYLAMQIIDKHTK